MISPLEEHEALKRIDNIEKVAYERLFTNYLRRNLIGEKKLIDITTTDQESIATKIAIAIPGMIYTFINVNDKLLDQIENFKTGKFVEFHDITPILFCTSYNPFSRIIKGLNLNMLPNETRLHFLQSFWEMYEKFFERVEEKTEYQKEALNKKYIIAAMGGKNSEIIRAFNNKCGALFEFAYRSYKLENIKNYRMIEYSEWSFIPFYNAENSFRKIGMKKIYQLYTINKNKT